MNLSDVEEINRLLEKREQFTKDLVFLKGVARIIINNTEAEKELFTHAQNYLLSAKREERRLVELELASKDVQLTKNDKTWEDFIEE